MTTIATPSAAAPSRRSGCDSETQDPHLPWAHPAKYHQSALTESRDKVKNHRFFSVTAKRHSFPIFHNSVQLCRRSIFQFFQRVLLCDLCQNLKHHHFKNIKAINSTGGVVMVVTDKATSRTNWISRRNWLFRQHTASKKVVFPEPLGPNKPEIEQGQNSSTRRLQHHMLPHYPIPSDFTISRLINSTTPHWVNKQKRINIEARNNKKANETPNENARIQRPPVRRPSKGFAHQLK